MAQELIDVMMAESFATKVATQSDLIQAREAARQIASTVGFKPAECEEIALVVSELASNLIEHASGGTIRIGPLEPPERAGIRIESEDSGPGIPDIERALTDGFSTAG